MPEPERRPDELLTPKEVAAIFRVNPKTVARWNRVGWLPAVRTLGGHRRYRWDVVSNALAKSEAPA